MHLYLAARVVGRELLIEIVASKNGPMLDDTVSRVMNELYAIGIKPDWWKLEPQENGAAWDAIGKVIDARDPLCRGVVMLGLDAPEAELAKGFKTVADKPHVKGFAVGRTIFLEAAEAWLAGKMTDAAAVDNMATKYASLVKIWNEARS
jgi:5-dehydro-2-deoxygluconokinase